MVQPSWQTDRESRLVEALHFSFVQGIGSRRCPLGEGQEVADSQDG
jgi:hypothetical protein